jgi:hypothetical protein
MEPATRDRLFPFQVNVGPDTDPESIAAVVGEVRRIQFRKPLPQKTLDAIAEALRGHPDVSLRIWGRWLDPSLEFLRGFEHVQGLYIDSWFTESFEPLAGFTELRRLGLNQTKSTRPSLDVLRNFPKLESLFIEGHDRDFEAVGSLKQLRALSLRASRVKSIECLRGHPGLEQVSVSFGGLRDLSPLPTMARLRDLSLHQIRGLTSEDLRPIGNCAHMDALSLGNLNRVETLGVLRSAQVRFLGLEGMTIDSLEVLANLPRLESIVLVNTLVADRSIMALLHCGSLRHALIGHANREVFSDEDILSFMEEFKGESFWYRNRHPRGTARLGAFWDVVKQLRGEGDLR